MPQSLDRYVYTANNPLRYVDPTGESPWNPFDWLGKALDAAGKALSKIADAVVGVLDVVMTVVGFIPGLDALLLPVGGSVFRMAKKAVNALDGAGDAGKVLKNGANAAEAAKGAAKADGVASPSLSAVKTSGSPAPSKKPSSIAQNAQQGAAGEAKVVTMFRQAGFDVRPYKQRVDTGVGPRYPDLAVYNPSNPDEILGFIEVKSGNAVYSWSQRAKDALMVDRNGKHIPTYLIRV